MGSDESRPEWAPRDANDAFTTSVRRGIPDPAGDTPAPKKMARARPPRLADPEKLAEAIQNSDRTALARAITLIESNKLEHQDLAADLLQRLADQPRSRPAIRIGITGVPGAGKSTFIECFGRQLCSEGLKIAVLAIDPSSVRTGGSILGDKTRMEELSREPNAFIRPSPSGGALGGVARRTRETMILCETAGYDVIIVETVGVGQSEGLVREMVDFFLLVLIAGAGDELQGIKRGVMELADAILVNKADGDNVARARAARADLERVLHYLLPATDGWRTRALCCSAMTGDGVPQVWELIQSFRASTERAGSFQTRRQTQNVSWMERTLREEVVRRFLEREPVRLKLAVMRERVAQGTLSPNAAVQALLSE